jgi:hypothetical protein
MGIKTHLGEGNVFTGETSSGDKIVGVTLQKTDKTKYSETTKVIGIMQRQGDRDRLTLSQDALYLRMRTTLNSPSLELGNFSLSSRVGVEAKILAMQNKTKKDNGSTKESFNVDSMVSPIIGATANWNSEDKKTEVSADVEVEGYAINKNVQLTPLEGMTLAFNKTTIRTGITHDVTDQMRIVGQTGIVVREMGSSAQFSAGVLNGNTNSQYRSMATYSTPISNDIPAFLPESQRTFGFSHSGEKRKSGAYYQLDYTHDLDNDSNALSASTGWKF